MRHLLRAGLAIALLVGFYVLALGLCAGLVAGVVELVLHGADWAVGLRLGIFIVPVVLGIAVGVLGRSRPPAPTGVVLTEAAEPALWAMARELAELAGTRCADEIRLVPEPNAAVSDSSTWLGLRPGPRRLHLGAPLLLGLDADQVRSVLAHEFGHYSGHHTALAGITYRGAEAIRRTTQQLGRGHLVSRLFLLYARLYFAVSHTVNRRQELEADQLSARVAGPEVAATALLSLRPLARAWEAYLDHFGDLGLAGGRRPAGLAEGFAAYLADPRVQQRMAELAEAPYDEPTSVFDTHPSTARRVAALRALPPTAPPAPRADPSTTARPSAGSLAALDAELYGARALEPTPLAELVPLAYAERTMRFAHAFDAALLEQGRTPGLDTVFQALRNGTTRQVLGGLVEAVDDAAFTKATGALLGQYLGASLLAAGQASYRLDWLSGGELVDAAGGPLELESLVAEVIGTPALAPDLRELLRLSGVARDWRAPEPAATARSGGPVSVVGVVSPVSHGRSLVVTDGGLLWLTQSGSDLLAVAARHDRSREAITLLERYRQLPLGELITSRNARVVPWESVVELRVEQRGRHRAHITCVVADGPPFVVRVTKGSQEAGQTWGPCEQFLGARFTVAESGRVPARV